MRGMTATLKKISEYIKSISPSNPQKEIDKVWLENHQTKITTQLISLNESVKIKNHTYIQQSIKLPLSLITAYHSISPSITPFPLSAFIPPKRKKESPGDKSPELSRVWKEAATYSPALHCSTIGAGGLNFSVRNGKRWDTAAITTWLGVWLSHKQAKKKWRLTRDLRPAALRLDGRRHGWGEGR